MRLFDRLRADPDERSPAVAALHRAMREASDHPSAEANARIFAMLREINLWAPAVGPVAAPERLQAQAALSGSVSFLFRAGRTAEGETFLPTATTAARLERSGHLQPGDTAMRLPFAMLAYAAHSVRAEALVINPGTTPMAHLAGGALASLADGLIPDERKPDTAAKIHRTDLPELAPIEGMATERLLAAARDVAAQIPEVADAAVGVRPLSDARMFTLLVVLSRPVDEARLRAFVGQRLAAAIPPDDYVAAEVVTHLPEDRLGIRVK